VDAASGAWNDVDPNYRAQLTPVPTALPPPVATAASVPSPTTPSGPPPEMSESDRKATARAAFQEGVQMQEANNCKEALNRFETAQKFYPAPTHLLRIGQCQTTLGKLVEAQETYETLTRQSIQANAP